MAKTNKKAKELTLNTETAQTNEQPQIPQMPEVRSVTRWAPDASISITGVEWEVIQNSLVALQSAQQAAQAVLSRNIVEGTIQVDFEKLNAKSLQYEQMTDEEKAPYVESMKTQIDAIKQGITPAK